MIAVEPQQPGYLSHGDAAAAPVDRFRTDKPSSSIIVRSACPARCSASRTRASRSPSAISTADRQTLEPAFPVDPFFAQHGLSIQRRPPRRLPDRLLTHHISPIDVRPASRTPADFKIRCATQTREYPTTGQTAAASGRNSALIRE